MDFFLENFFIPVKKEEKKLQSEKLFAQTTLQTSNAKVAAFRVPSMLSIVALYSSGFACHYNSPKFYKELQGASPSKFLWVSIVSFCIVTVLFVVFAGAGYMRFGGILIKQQRHVVI